MAAMWSKKGMKTWGLLIVALMLFASVCDVIALPEIESDEISPLIAKDVTYSTQISVANITNSSVNPLAPFEGSSSSFITESYDFVPGEIIVKFKQNVQFTIPQQTDGVVTTGISSLDTLNQRYQVTSLVKVFETAEKPVSEEIPDLTNVYVLTLPQDADILSIINEYQRDQNVEYAKPNYILKTSAIPKDPYYASQWANQFTITSGGGSFSLDAGASKTIKVKFCPTTTGSKSATLIADGSNCDDDSSSLSGIGIASASGPTYVNGPITSDTTWTLANSPYIVAGNVLVNTGVTLTIEPGVIVKFNNSLALQVDGTLIARGTTDNRITFTSNQLTPAAGDWGYILFSDSSTDATYDGNGDYISGCILEYCIVEYAGGVSVANNGAVRANNAHPFINSCTIIHNNARGICAYNLAGLFKITNSTISYNLASPSGGGIMVSGSEFIIAQNTISHNTADCGDNGGGGGGIYASGQGTISNNTINSNSVYGYMADGGGIDTSSGTTTISGNTISNNIAEYSGGGISTGSIATVFNNIVNNNVALKTGGGGIAVWVTTTIDNNIIICNEAPNGGGVWGYWQRKVTISNSTINNNKAYGGGGGIGSSPVGLDLTINSCIISNNLAIGNGGGVDNAPYLGITTIKNSIISHNTALGVGGGIYCNGILSNNSIVMNSASNAAGVHFYSGTDFKYNTVIGNTATGITPTCTVYVNYPLTFNYNNIFGNIATYELWNDYAQGSADVNATNNWWGTTDEAEIQAKIYDWFDDSSKGLVDYSPYLSIPFDYLGDNLWNFRYNAGDWFHDNEPWLRPWRYNYEDGWGRWVGMWAYEVPWSETYTQSSGSLGSITWNIDNTGNLHLSGDRDHQWHVWTYVYVSSPRNITIPASGDCVPRCFLNYAFDSPYTFPAMLHLDAGWNRLDITGYNQNSGYSFDLNYALSNSVELMSSIILEGPFIIGKIPPIYTAEDTNYSYDLTAHKFDLKDKNTNLTWSVSDVNTSLFSASINPGDVLSIIPVSNAYGADIITLILTDSDGNTASQDVIVTIFSVNDPPIADFTYSPANPIVSQAITFNASNSSDIDGFISNYNWDFGDGDIKSTADSFITHSYTSVGDYTVSLTVTDNGGATSTISKVAEVYGSKNEVYFNPNKTMASYCHTTGVEIRVNATNLQAGQIKLSYNSSCANVTNWERNIAIFPMGGWDSSTSGQEWITFMGAGPLAGDYKIGTLTVHCTCDCECTTPLDFLTPSALFDQNGTVISTTWLDGSFKCTLGICGDVAPYPKGDEQVNMGDVVRLLNNVSYPGQYFVDEWVGNVNCINGINMGDVVLLLNNVSYPGQYPLNCCLS